MKDPRIEALKKEVEEILGSKTNLRKKRSSKKEDEKHFFFTMIPVLERVYLDQHLLDEEFHIDINQHNEKFFKIIDKLLILFYGKDGFQIISYYCYSRIGPKGELIPIKVKGEDIVIESIEQLWDLVDKLRK